MIFPSSLKALSIVRVTLFMALALTIVACNGCNRFGGHDASSDSQASGNTSVLSYSSVPADLTAGALAAADSILRSMSLEERVGQCFMPAILSSGDEAVMARLRHYVDTLHVGGIVLLKGDLAGAASMSARAAEARIPLFTAIDAEWGLGMRLSDAPDFPRNGRISPEADERLLFDYGREVARECRRVGINMVLGPVIDVVENPRGVIGNRSFGSDPVRVADLGVAYARGLESGGVFSVAKHFPGHGSPAGDSHRQLPVIGRSLHQLDSIDLYPFRAYIESGLSGVMVGHLAVPAIDPDALPAAVSPVVIRQLLRKELGFNGLVLTDALNMGGADGHNAVDALRAGADIVIGPAGTADEISAVISAVTAAGSAGSGTHTDMKPGEWSRLTETDIDDRCRRILFYKFLLGHSFTASPKAIEADSAASSLRRDVESGASGLRRRLSR